MITTEIKEKKINVILVLKDRIDCERNAILGWFFTNLFIFDEIPKTVIDINFIIII
jgi:hypothetical protein